MPPLRHFKKISATLMATLSAATSSVTLSPTPSFAEDKNTSDKRAIASAAGAQTKSATKPPGTTKPVNSKLVYPRTHFEKAYYFKQKHDLNNALIEFIKSTQENPLQVRGFYEQALIFRERGYLKLAASSLEQALAVKPDYQDARILLATISIQQGNVGGAVRELTRSLGLENAIIKNDIEPKTPLQKATKAVNDKVKEVDATVDAAPSVILQSIHSQLKYEKTLDAEPGVENSPKEEQKADSETTIAETQNDETSGKHFDFASIKDSLKDSFEAAIHAPFSLAAYWNHLPFGNPQLNEKDIKASAEKTADQTDDADTPKNKKERKKKKKKKERKHKKSDSSDTDSKQSELEVAEASTSSKSETGETTAALPDFVQKAIAEHKEAEESAQASTQAPPEQNKTLFAATDFSQSTHSLINGLKPAENAKEVDAPKPAPVHLDSDEWAVKLKDLADHGTNSLKEGEAFMFAEDTGEASLFLADGQVIRRIIAVPRDQAEIVRQRRPDMLIPDDLLYKLSLLGKLIPHPENSTPQNADPNQATVKTDVSGASEANKTGKDFKVENVMGESQNFWGWLKNAFKF